ncbi:PepSY domain-containing protein [Alteromonas lipolytica]
MLTLSAPVSAQQSQDQRGASSKREAAAQAKKEVDGRVLRVDQQNSKYRVKVLKKSGRVVSVDVDKRNVKKKKDKDQDNDH